MHRLKDFLMLTDKGYSDLKKAIGACTLSNLALMLPFIITIQIFAQLLKPLTGGTMNTSALWMLWTGGLAAAAVVFLASKNEYKKTYVTSYLEAENSRLGVVEQIRRLPMSFFNTRDLSELTTNIMADCATTEHVLSHIIPQLFANAISILLICILTALYDWRMALSMFCTVPISAGIVLGSKKLQNRLSEKQVEAKLNASGQIQEYLEGIKVIKACGLGGAKFSSLNRALLLLKKMAIRMEVVTGIFITGVQMVLQAGVGITVFTGTYLLTKGKIEFIPLLMFFVIVVKIYGPLIVELTLLPELFYHRTSAKRMRTLMNASMMEGDFKQQLKDWSIRFDNVSFGYNSQGQEEGTVLKNLSFQIPANAITALVGPSGCGKSTVSKLIARFWDVNSGCIKIGGIDIKALEPEHLMGYMSFVFQDVILFNDTIYSNILIGNRNASEEEVLKAAKAACCEEFVSKLPEGYNTMLGENGYTLSGGERQRISIARALLKNSPIVLLDEATASLDPENEVLIQQAISKLIQGKTVIVIAHRLRTVESADKIIVLEDGKLAEEGDHAGLMQKKGLYERLYRMQQDSLGWSV